MSFWKIVLTKRESDYDEQIGCKFEVSDSVAADTMFGGVLVLDSGSTIKLDSTQTTLILELLRGIKTINHKQVQMRPFGERP
jgi:hypothetical protein